MKTYRLSRRAGRSLEDIASYIGKQSADPERGAAFVSRLRAQCEKLATLPGLIGRPRPDLGTETRSFVYGNYSIAFRYRPDTIDILDIVHVRRDSGEHPDNG
ncbi:MAG: type II toxin-antitoxin system RelE/ParE family toxin [Devosia sp.]|nr:type II toxin-antitoxin system RelE/ParE family toxin [Devosia sp.]